MSDSVRIAGVKYLNARPLLAGLEAGISAPFAYGLTRIDPAHCAAALRDGTATVATVPVAALADLPAVQVVGSLGIACRREAASVLLFSPRPLPQVRSLAVHAASRTSVALARLLLAERWGARPTVVPVDPPLNSMLERADAALVIGDAAFAARQQAEPALDLGLAWTQWTGLPFVFAVWAVRGEVPAGLVATLEASLAYGEAHWRQLVPLWAREHGVSEELAGRYLGETITFRLGREERAGLAEFARRAAAAGVLPRHRVTWL